MSESTTYRWIMPGSTEPSEAELSNAFGEAEEDPKADS